jgi:arylsulfatase A-like enzyme
VSSRLSWLLAVLLCSWASRGAAQSAAARGSPATSDLERSATPSVLVILGDDFNWTDLGSVPTPNLDGLAARGMTFRRAYSFPICSPTRYGLVFGRYPRRDGIGALVQFAPPGPENPTPPLELTSLAEALRTRSQWARTAIFGKWHLGTNPWFDDREPDLGPYNFGALTPNLQGFDRWFGSMGNLSDYSTWTSVSNGVFLPSDEYASGAVLREFLRWWQGTQGQRFAYVAFHNAHADYHAPPPEFLPPGYPTPRGSRQEFEAMLASLDFMLGRMLETVDLSDTYVFFLSDNGTPRGVSIEDCPPRPSEPFNPFDCAKHTVFEPGIRVPLFVAGPRIPPGTQSDALVSCVDVMATVCELLGVPSPGEDSVSFAPALRDPSCSPRRYVFSEIFGEFDQFNGIPAMKLESAAIGARYKLRRINGAERLYDLSIDPREAAPVPLSEPSVAQELAALRAVLDDPLDKALQLR